MSTRRPETEGKNETVTYGGTVAFGLNAEMERAKQELADKLAAEETDNDEG